MAVPGTTEKRPRKAFYRGDPFAGPPPRELVAILDRFRGRPDAVIAVLQAIQGTYGHLPRKPLAQAARELGLPLSRLYGVATFYHQFRFDPPGRFLTRICHGTACHVRGAPGIMRRLAGHLGVEEAQTTPDGLITLESVFCVGACSLAPVVMVDGRAHGNMTPERAVDLVGELAREAAGRPESEEG